MNKHEVPNGYEVLSSNFRDKSQALIEKFTIDKAKEASAGISALLPAWAIPSNWFKKLPVSQPREASEFQNIASEWIKIDTPELQAFNLASKELLDFFVKVAEEAQRKQRGGFLGFGTDPRVYSEKVQTLKSLAYMVRDRIENIPWQLSILPELYLIASFVDENFQPKSENKAANVSVTSSKSKSSEGSQSAEKIAEINNDDAVRVDNFLAAKNNPELLKHIRAINQLKETFPKEPTSLADLSNYVKQVLEKCAELAALPNTIAQNIAKIEFDRSKRWGITNFLFHRDEAKKLEQATKSLVAAQRLSAEAQSLAQNLESKQFRTLIAVSDAINTVQNYHPEEHLQGNPEKAKAVKNAIKLIFDQEDPLRNLALRQIESVLNSLELSIASVLEKIKGISSTDENIPPELITKLDLQLGLLQGINHKRVVSLKESLNSKIMEHVRALKSQKISAAIKYLGVLIPLAELLGNEATHALWSLDEITLTNIAANIKTVQDHRDNLLDDVTKLNTEQIKKVITAIGFLQNIKDPALKRQALKEIALLKSHQAPEEISEKDLDLYQKICDDLDEIRTSATKAADIADSKIDGFYSRLGVLQALAPEKVDSIYKITTGYINEFRTGKQTAAAVRFLEAMTRQLKTPVADASIFGAEEKVNLSRQHQLFIAWNWFEVEFPRFMHQEESTVTKTASSETFGTAIDDLLDAVISLVDEPAKRPHIDPEVLNPKFIETLQNKLPLLVAQDAFAEMRELAFGIVNNLRVFIEAQLKLLEKGNEPSSKVKGLVTCFSAGNVTLDHAGSVLTKGPLQSTRQHLLQQIKGSVSALGKDPKNLGSYLTRLEKIWPPADYEQDEELKNLIKSVKLKAAFQGEYAELHSRFDGVMKFLRGESGAAKTLLDKIFGTTQSNFGEEDRRTFKEGLHQFLEAFKKLSIQYRSEGDTVLANFVEQIIAEEIRSFITTLRSDFDRLVVNGKTNAEKSKVDLGILFLQYEVIKDLVDGMQITGLADLSELGTQIQRQVTVAAAENPNFVHEVAGRANAEQLAALKSNLTPDRPQFEITYVKHRIGDKDVQVGVARSNLFGLDSEQISRDVTITEIPQSALTSMVEEHVKQELAAQLNDCESKEISEERKKLLLEQVKFIVTELLEQVKYENSLSSPLGHEMVSSLRDQAYAVADKKSIEFNKQLLLWAGVSIPSTFNMSDMSTVMAANLALRAYFTEQNERIQTLLEATRKAKVFYEKHIADEEVRLMELGLQYKELLEQHSTSKSLLSSFLGSRKSVSPEEIQAELTKSQDEINDEIRKTQEKLQSAIIQEAHLVSTAAAIQAANEKKENEDIIMSLTDDAITMLDAPSMVVVRQFDEQHSQRMKDMKGQAEALVKLIEQVEAEKLTKLAQFPLSEKNSEKAKQLEKRYDARLGELKEEVVKLNGNIERQIEVWTQSRPDITRKLLKNLKEILEVRDLANKYGEKANALQTQIPRPEEVIKFISEFPMNIVGELPRDSRNYLEMMKYRFADRFKKFANIFGVKIQPNGKIELSLTPKQAELIAELEKDEEFKKFLALTMGKTEKEAFAKLQEMIKETKPKKTMPISVQRAAKQFVEQYHKRQMPLRDESKSQSALVAKTRDGGFPPADITGVPPPRVPISPPMAGKGKVTNPPAVKISYG